MMTSKNPSKNRQTCTNLVEEEDEEDYITDVRPGLTSASVAKLNKNEQKSKLMNSLNKERNKALNVIQQEKREEGLQSAIPKSNIGFQLLAKMGYKQDRGIGKSENGIKEPVPLNIKSDRKGLGHGDNKRTQKLFSSRREEEDRLKKMKLESQWRNRMRERWNDKEINRDLRKSQSVCERLDKNSLINIPQRTFFWPENLLPAVAANYLPDDDNDTIGDGGYDADDNNNNNNNGDDDCVESLNDDDDDDGYCKDGDSFANDVLSPMEKLEMITEYLRSVYHYCIWCGTEYDGVDDLKANCPGNNASVHE